jgi:diguanylate cyclase (GGDEF)-like protein/PAS domain S-box-containing protein
VSPSVERITGFNPAELIGSAALGEVHPDDLPAMETVFFDLVGRPGIHLSVEVRVRHRDGSWRMLEAVATNLLHDPAVEGLVINARDITDRKALEAQLLRQAFHDSLTGLANRALFLDRLGHATARTARGRESIAVLFIDLDGFKVVNDSLGHDMGDSLLREVADRLQESVRGGDTVARFGGDEFIVLLEGIDSDDEPIAVAGRIIERISQPLEIGERRVTVTASVGIALPTAEQLAPSEFVRRADVAMYVAKRNGKGRSALYQPRMDDALQARLGLEAELRRALERHELILHYQPIVDLETRTCIEVEALVRWQHPDRGLLLPSAFIPFAEENGLIVPLGQWVLATACAQWRAWFDDDPTRTLPVVSVNLSGRQLERPTIVVDILRTLDGSRFPPTHLKLEVTESVALQEADLAMERLIELRSHGIRVAVDDFGTGHAGLRSFRSYPADTLKIDRQYIATLGRDDAATTVVSAVLEFAHRLGLSVTAEGVETDEQAELLRALGCERGQGFRFGKPDTLDTVSALLAQDSLHASATDTSFTSQELQRSA